MDEVPHEAARRLGRAAAAYVRAHAPEEALRFLLELDANLYGLQGRVAVAYGGGVHTKHRHTRYHDFFVRRIRATETVLDIGCGQGALALDVAAKSGALVTAIDANEANIGEARARHAHANITYIQGAAPQALSCRHYDVAILSNVLEHVDQRVEFLREMARLATPTRWLLRVPLFERDWRVPLKRELGVEWRLDPTHCTEYTQESFAHEMHAAGLTIAHQETRWGEIWSELHPAA